MVTSRRENCWWELPIFEKPDQQRAEESFLKEVSYQGCPVTVQDHKDLPCRAEGHPSPVSFGEGPTWHIQAALGPARPSAAHHHLPSLIRGCVKPSAKTTAASHWFLSHLPLQSRLQPLLWGQFVLSWPLPTLPHVLLWQRPHPASTRAILSSPVSI